jgi:hypothetical protein
MPSGGGIIVNPATPSSTTPGVVVVGGSTITANSNSAFVIGSQTLTPGGAITNSGEVITLPPLTAPPSMPTDTMPVIVVGGSTYTENTQSQLIIGSQTLTPGGVITINGQAISMSPTGNAVVINGAQPSTFVTSPPVSDITSLMIAGQTLTANGVITVGGEILSLAPFGTNIDIVGTVTIGGGESTATATAVGHAKNAGPKTGFSMLVITLQFSLSVLAFWLH